MSFASSLDNLPLQKSRLLRRFEDLIAPASDAELEQLAQESRSLTLQNFGRTMRLFAPLYLSNECINNCRYCGFSRDNPILRVTLQSRAGGSGGAISGRGGISPGSARGRRTPEVCQPRTIWLIASGPWLPISHRSPLRWAQWRRTIMCPSSRPAPKAWWFIRRPTTGKFMPRCTPSGPKRDFGWRLDCAERGYEAGFRRLGIGALFGLAPWKQEALGLAAHVEYLLKRCWQAQITVSLPRLRPAAGEFQPAFSDDRSRTCPTHLRVPDHLSPGGDCSQHAENEPHCGTRWLRWASP